MSISRRAFCALATASACVVAAPLTHAAPPGAAGANSAVVALTGEALTLARWVARSGDHGGRPFTIVDKKGARAFVFGSNGRLAGATAVLLGAAPGDHSTPGIGNVAPVRIPLADRTTPAGRFVSEPGRNLDGEAVVWFDYEAGLAIHRLRTNASHGTRLDLLASNAPQARRVSAGCVVVPVAFYESVIAPILGRGRGVLYVLPEQTSMHAVFARLVDD